MESIDCIIRAARERGCSDIHLTSGQPVSYRRIGRLEPDGPAVLQGAAHLFGPDYLAGCTGFLVHLGALLSLAAASSAPLAAPYTAQFARSAAPASQLVPLRWTRPGFLGCFIE